jgi:hypothetical protein
MRRVGGRHIIGRWPLPNWNPSDRTPRSAVGRTLGFWLQGAIGHDIPIRRSTWIEAEY